MTLAEKKLKESEERFKALFKGSPVPTYAWQKIGDSFNLVDYNNAADKITRGTIKNYLGFKASKMYRDRLDIIDDLNRCFDEKINIDREIKYYFNVLQQEKYLLVKYSFIPPDLVLVHTEDITERKSAEENVQYQAKLVEDVSDAIISTDLDFKIITWNKAAELMYGWKAEKTIGKSLNDIIPVEYPYDDQEVVLKQFFEEGFWKGEVIQNHKDGTPINILASVSLIKDIKGNPKGAVAINRNVTEWRKSEESLRESEQLYRSLTEGLSQTGIGIDVLDSNYNIIYQNQFLKDQFGEHQNRQCFDFYLGREDCCDDCQMMKAIQNRKFERAIINAPNNHTYEVLAVPLPNPTGIIEKVAEVVIDITKRIESEQKLKDSESNFRTIFEAIPDLYFLLSEDTTILDYRGKKHELYVNPEKFMGKKVVDLLPPYIGEQTKSLVEKTIITKQPQSLEYELRIQDKIHFYEARYFYLSKNRVSCFIRDITERKRIEKEISDLAKFPSENPNPVLRVNKEKILYINLAGRDLFDMTEGSNIPYLLEEKIIKALDDNTTKISEVNIEDKIYLFNIASVQQEGYANIYGQDITEKKNSELALKVEKKFTEDILNSSVDTIFVFEPETGRAVRWNNVFNIVTGYSNEEISSMKVPDSYYSVEDLKRASEASKQVLKEGETTVEMSLITKDGRRVPYEYRGTTFKSSDGKLLIVSVGRDMTERKAAEEKLKKSETKYREAFDNANFYKDLFTHDMNNILQIINSSAELISFQLVDSEKSKYIGNMSNMIQTQIERGSKLISNVRTLSEIEEGEVTTKQTEVSAFLENSINFIKKAYSERQITISIDKIKGAILTNANELLEDVFENILINAVKYNENLEVEISIKISKQKIDMNNYIKIEFIDNGIGVADSRKELIFKRGYRELKGSKGMGLGLSLVSKILTIFNGKIRVEDRVKGDYTKGSNFNILLPLIN